MNATPQFRRLDLSSIIIGRNGANARLPSTQFPRAASTMIEVPTTLILGAGASSHCGYPLGMQLIDELCKTNLNTIELPDQFDRQQYHDFVKRLSRSGHYSIDAFLEENSDLAELGKILLALNLKQHEDAARLFPPHNSGWYQYLFNCLLVQGKPEFHKNKLSIITFNYDRSLEAYLLEALQHRFCIDEATASSIVEELPITHVHGMLGSLRQLKYENRFKPSDLMQASKSIQIIHEINDCADGFCNTEFEKSHGMLAAADRIYFLGFGFHEANVRRFSFFGAEPSRGKVIQSTYMGSMGFERKSLIDRLTPFGFTDRSFPNYTSCQDFFRIVARLE